MRIRIILLTTFFVLVSVFALALPKIEVYRYTVKDAKTVAYDHVLHPLTGFDPWVLDDASWPKDKRILLLVHGFPMFKNGKMRLTMNGLGVYFSQERKIGVVTLPAYDAIYAVDYPKNNDIFETGKALAVLIQEKTNGFALNQKIDIFAHSMGGLVVRVAIEKNVLKTVANKVDHIVFMGTPQNGFSIDEFNCFKDNLDFLLTELDDLNPDKQFIYMINLDTKSPVSCSYYSVVGLKSDYPKKFLEGENVVSSGFSKIFKNIQDKNFPVHDGLISSESAGFNLSPYCKSFKLDTKQLNHEYINNHQWVFDAIDKWMIDDKWFSANQTPAVQPKIKKFTGGLPMVLNKSRQEIVKLFGDNCMRRELSGGFDYRREADNIEDTSEWAYISNSMNDIYFTPIVYFVPYALLGGFNLDFGVSSNKVLNNLSNQVQAIKYEYIHIKTGKTFLDRGPVSPKSIVAKEILEQEPAEICWYYEGGRQEVYGLVIIWKINGDTYVLVVNDSKNNLVDIKKLDSQGDFRVCRNKNTSNFRQADLVVCFAQIKGDINFFGRKSDWEHHANYNDPGLDFKDRGYFDRYGLYKFFDK
jgi:hypothetical protein